MIKVKIVPKDSKKVVKVVIIDDDNRVLMLKRSNYVDKYAGEWDLPGGHIQVGEELSVGMRREVKEETGLEINNPIFVQKIENLDFYTCPYNGKPIKMSHEHTGFRFFKEDDLNPSKKFEKVALRALEMKNDKT
tara:strand:- start:165 stop:566 length:402 start_codon:yes stop_codon:yes gene_type:complete